MGHEAQHAAPDSVLAELEAGRVAERAAAWVARMNGWLHAPVTTPTPMDSVPSDVAEMCREARDLLSLLASPESM